MIFYIIRHAHASDASHDASRPLSERGRGEVARVAKFLKAAGGLPAVEFWHSPLLRAAQTAELLAHGLGSKAPLLLVPGLEPDDDPSEIAARLSTAPRPVAVVGHDPNLTALGTLLVRKVPWPPVFVMSKCTVLALERDGHGRDVAWAARWQLAPELFEA